MQQNEVHPQPSKEQGDKSSVDRRELLEALGPTECKSCCFTINPKMVLFLFQACFSAFVFIFSAWKLRGDQPPDPLWVSILTSMIGLWLPNPNYHHPGA